jgi:hypothetical protein
MTSDTSRFTVFKDACEYLSSNGTLSIADASESGVHSYTGHPSFARYTRGSFSVAESIAAMYPGRMLGFLVNIDWQAHSVGLESVILTLPKILPLDKGMIGSQLAIITLDAISLVML